MSAFSARVVNGNTRVMSQQNTHRPTDVPALLAEQSRPVPVFIPLLEVAFVSQAPDLEALHRGVDGCGGGGGGVARQQRRGGEAVALGPPPQRAPRQPRTQGLPTPLRFRVRV